MIACQICGDMQGPWEYEEYKSANKKPWLIEDGTTILVCEECAKILKKRMKKERQKEKNNDELKKMYTFV